MGRLRSPRTHLTNETEYSLQKLTFYNLGHNFKQEMHFTKDLEKITELRYAKFTKTKTLWSWACATTCDMVKKKCVIYTKFGVLETGSRRVFKKNVSSTKRRHSQHLSILRNLHAHPWICKLCQRHFGTIKWNFGLPYWCSILNKCRFQPLQHQDGVVPFRKWG